MSKPIDPRRVMYYIVSALGLVAIAAVSIMLTVIIVAVIDQHSGPHPRPGDTQCVVRDGQWLCGGQR